MLQVIFKLTVALPEECGRGKGYKEDIRIREVLEG